MAGARTAAQDRLITGAELLQIGDLGPCELIDGRVVPMTPTSGRHGRIEGNFYRALDEFARSGHLGKVLVGEVGIFTQRSPDRVRAADVLFVSNETYERQTDPLGFLEVAPELVVEILSPSDRALETTQKLREYFAIGVRIVWVADPVARTVYVYRSLTDVHEFRDNDRLHGDDVLPGFEVSVASLFEE